MVEAVDFRKGVLNCPGQGSSAGKPSLLDKMIGEASKLNELKLITLRVRLGNRLDHDRHYYYSCAQEFLGLDSRIGASSLMIIFNLIIHLMLKRYLQVSRAMDVIDNLVPVCYDLSPIRYYSGCKSIRICITFKLFKLLFITFYVEQ